MDPKNSVDLSERSAATSNFGSFSGETGNLDTADSLSSKSYASYKSAVTNLADSRNYSSIISTPVENDPLLSPFAETDHASSSESSEAMNSVYSDVAISPLEENGKSATGSGDVDADAADAAYRSAIASHKSSLYGFNSSSSKTNEYLYVAVSNPQKEHDISNSIVPGGNVYVSYLITTKTNIAGFGGSEFSVRRRFRDVVTLAERLAESYRGIFIPPRPDKSVVESQVMHKQEFVEHRRVALEKYLKRLASHPVLRKSNELKLFLQVPGRLPLPPSTDAASRVLDGAVKLPLQLFGDLGTVMSPQEAKLPARGGRNLLRVFKELKQSVTNEWAGSKLPRSEEDKSLMEEKEKLHGFELCLSHASKQAESLVKAEQDTGNTMGELGLAFIRLTKLENENALFNSQRTHASHLKSIATASIRSSRIYRALNAKSSRNLDTLHEYLAIMFAARHAFSDQSSALLTVQTLTSELYFLQSKIEKLEVSSARHKDRSRDQKVDELKETLRITDEAKRSAIGEYEQIKENCLTELDRLNREKRSDLLNMMKGFVKDQVECAEKMANVWMEVADHTGDFALESS